MSFFNAARQTFARSAPQGVRFASTSTTPASKGFVHHAWWQPMSIGERLKAYTPTEALPLVVACVAMPTFMFVNAYWALVRCGATGELRLAPSSWNEKKATKEVWED